MYNTQKSNLIEKTITLANVEDTGTQIKITDEQNNFYSFFKNKKSGEQSAAFTDLQAFGSGQSVNVVYEEKPGNNGNVFRNIARIKPAGGQVTTTETAPTPSLENRFKFNNVPSNLPNTGFGNVPPVPMPGRDASHHAPLPRDLSPTARAFAKSLLESHQATPQDLINPQWWATIIFPPINAMIEGGSVATTDDDISVEDIPF